MYTSPIPLVMIRSDVHALIEVNSQLLGECTAGSFLPLPVADSGDYFICAVPLSDGGRYAVTRKLSFDSGRLSSPITQDMAVCSWPGGVYELMIATGSFARNAGRPFPYTVESLDISLGNEVYKLTLYYENGFRLAAEAGGRPLSGYSLGDGLTASLYAVSGTNCRFAAVRIGLAKKKERLLLFSAGLDAVLDITGDAVLVSGGHVELIEKLSTLMGHERRTRYALTGPALRPLPPETGFFTCEQPMPKTELSLATAFCEAVREGFEAEAMEYLSGGLRSRLAFDAIRDFLGGFSSARPPVSDISGRYMGLITEEGERLSSARLFEFEFEGLLISNISEV